MNLLRWFLLTLFGRPAVVDYQEISIFKVIKRYTAGFGQKETFLESHAEVPPTGALHAHAQSSTANPDEFSALGRP